MVLMAGLSALGYNLKVFKKFLYDFAIGELSHIESVWH